MPELYFYLETRQADLFAAKSLHEITVETLFNHLHSTLCIAFDWIGLHEWNAWNWPNLRKFHRWGDRWKPVQIPRHPAAPRRNDRSYSHLCQIEMNQFEIAINRNLSVDTIQFPRVSQQLGNWNDHLFFLHSLSLSLSNVYFSLN